MLAYVFSAPLLIVYAMAYAYEYVFSFIRTRLEAVIFCSPACVACCAQPSEAEDPLTWFAL